MTRSTKAVAEYDYDYVFHLDFELANLAKTELRETDELRKSSLNALRIWMDQNPKIVKSRYDSSFLLRFLRVHKFSIPIVQEAIERYCLLRQCYDNSVFLNVSLKEPMVADLLNKGLVFPLPRRDSLGRRVLLIRPKVFDCQKHNFRDMIRLFTITTDFLIEDEVNQIRGFVYLVDADGASLQLLTLVTPKEAVKLVRNGEAVVPMRHALGIGYNIPSGLKMAVDFALSFLSEKLRNRARIINDLGKCPEIDKSILPKEFGGGPETIADMIGRWKKEMDNPSRLKLIEQNDQLRANLLAFSQREMDGEFRKKKFITDPTCEMDAIPGSFRKMQVD